MGSGEFRDFQRVDSIVQRALDLPPEARNDFLLEACGPDAELLDHAREVLSLALDDHPELSPGAGLQALGTGDAASGATTASAGERFGPWRILEETGSGGMAKVYRAERADGAYQQQVAVKLLHRTGDAGTPKKRFEHERNLLARLEHPNIARLLDGGTTDDGRSYIVMEYIEGERIDHYCDARTLSIEARLKLFLQVCDAVQFAHRQLIVHRDIKPSNILVTSDGSPKLLDFGIAKLLETDGEATDMTQTVLAHRMLTPQYASPEQVLGEPVSTATDVHGLGLLLYEMLSGHRARVIDSTRPRAIEQAVCETQPTAPSLACTTNRTPGTTHSAQSPEDIASARQLTPSHLQRRLRGDLDNIVMMALRREPERRYATAQQMADDIRNFLALRPVRARPDSLSYRVDRYMRRHAAGLAILVVVAVLLASTVAYYTDRLARQRDAAESLAREAQIEAERSASVTQFLVELFRSAEPDRPADQLPDTESLLELGAQRALNAGTAPPEERLKMLEILGQVYLEQGRFDQARPLLDAAIELARALEPPRPGDLAEALMDRAYLEWRGRSPANAERYLVEAQSLVADDEQHIEAWVRAVMDRAWVASLLRDHNRAIEILQPVYEQVRDRTDLNPGTLYRVIERLSSAYQKLGDLQISSRLRKESERFLLREHGTLSRAYAIHLNNSSNLEHNLGRFETAERLNREALDLANRIYLEGPNGFRAVARRNLVRKLLTQGRFEEGLAELDKSTNELARVYGIVRESHASHHFYYGEMLMMMRRWADAQAHLQTARRLFAEAEDTDDHWILSTTAMLAWAVCQRNNADEATALFEELNVLTGESPSMGGNAEARIRSAMACMHWRLGDNQQALSEIERALEEAPHPGTLIERADRGFLRGQILHAMGDTNAGLDAAQAAVDLFTQHGLPDHPNAVQLQQAMSAMRQVSGTE